MYKKNIRYSYSDLPFSCVESILPLFQQYVCRPTGLMAALLHPTFNTRGWANKEGEKYIKHHYLTVLSAHFIESFISNNSPVFLSFSVLMHFILFRVGIFAVPPSVTLQQTLLREESKFVHVRGNSPGKTFQQLRKLQNRGGKKNTGLQVQQLRILQLIVGAKDLILSALRPMHFFSWQKKLRIMLKKN